MSPFLNSLVMESREKISFSYYTDFICDHLKRTKNDNLLFYLAYLENRSIPLIPSYYVIDVFRKNDLLFQIQDDVAKRISTILEEDAKHTRDLFFNELKKNISYVNPIFHKNLMDLNAVYVNKNESYMTYYLLDLQNQFNKKTKSFPASF